MGLKSLNLTEAYGEESSVWGFNKKFYFARI